MKMDKRIRYKFWKYVTQFVHGNRTYAMAQEYERYYGQGVATPSQNRLESLMRICLKFRCKNREEVNSNA